MDEGFVKFVGIAIAVGVVSFGIYAKASDNSGTLFLIVLAIIAVPALFFIFARAEETHNQSKLSTGMPVEGPMKVNLNIERRWNGKHRLHIDVKITAKDWAAIKRAGLNQSYILFEHDGVTSVHNYYGVGHLPRIKHVDFDSYLEAEMAKNDLITNLQNLRSRIDQQHDIVARPAEQKESYEI